MVIKNLEHSNKEVTNFMLEVLANSMKSELDNILKSNYEMSCIKDSFENISPNFQRKQLILYLLNVKEVNDVNHLSENFVSI
jgi:hypothetical protein